MPCAPPAESPLGPAMKSCPFRGSYVALPTPFRRGEVDLDAFAALVRFQREHDTAGIVVAGSTGESMTLRAEEKQVLIERAVEAAAGQLQVIAGIGACGTAETVAFGQAAARAGVDGALVVTPPYVRPGRRGLKAHFSAVAKSVDLPIILYNVAYRTGSDMEVELVAELGEEHGNVVALKEATTDSERIEALARESGVPLLAGEDRCIAEFVRQGAVGVIGVVSNLVPDAVSGLVRAVESGDGAAAGDFARPIDAALEALAIGGNPVTVKAALAMMGLGSAEVRSPLVELTPGELRSLEAALGAANLLGSARG